MVSPPGAARGLLLEICYVELKSERLRIMSSLSIFVLETKDFRGVWMPEAGVYVCTFLEGPRALVLLVLVSPDL